MTIITHFLAFAAGGVTVWVLKAKIGTELNSLHAKIDGVIAAIKAKV